MQLIGKNRDTCLKVDTLLVYNKEGRKQALMTADILRREGMYIENSLLDGDIEANKEYAKAKNIDGILYFVDNKNIELINLRTNNTVKTTVDLLLEGSEGREEN